MMVRLLIRMPGFSISIKRTPPGRRVLDDGLGIGLAKFDMGRTQNCFGRSPWLVKVSVRQGLQFRYEFAHVTSLQVELFTLQNRIENPEIRGGISARSGYPLPACSIVCRISIDKRIPKPFLALAPIDKQMLDQKGRDDHTHTIVHPSGLPELPHTRIDDRIAGHATLPREKLVSVVFPWKCVERGIEVPQVQPGIVKEEMIGELAPSQLLAKLLDTGALIFEFR